MIDTDKYKGHTPAQWMMGEYKGRPSIHAGNETFVRSIARGLNPSQTADHALLLDAPLLLAEVKRLREGIKEQMQFALDCVGSDIGDLYETIAEDLRRLIE